MSRKLSRDSVGHVSLSFSIFAKISEDPTSVNEKALAEYSMSSASSKTCREVSSTALLCVQVSTSSTSTSLEERVLRRRFRKSYTAELAISGILDMLWKACLSTPSTVPIRSSPPNVMILKTFSPNTSLHIVRRSSGGRRSNGEFARFLRLSPISARCVQIWQKTHYISVTASVRAIIVQLEYHSRCQSPFGRGPT